MQEITFTPSDFVAVLNQSLEYAYPQVSIVGELANFKVSRGKWVYFDLKDESSSVRFFGTVYTLPGPLEEGMVLRVSGAPRMSNKYGFSVNISSIVPEGEGSIKKAANLLAAKLEKEGLFKPERKRVLPYPPEKIALITSKESAAYADFTKILNVRWGGMTIYHHEVQVQGERAIEQIKNAIETLNNQSAGIEVIVIIRGGGSADDLAAFSTEPVVRAVAASRVPTLVAIGHESDTSLAELAADMRASTPSNAAELLVPDKLEQEKNLKAYANQLNSALKHNFQDTQHELVKQRQTLRTAVKTVLQNAHDVLTGKVQVLKALDPSAVMARGFSVVKTASGTLVKSSKDIAVGDSVSINFSEGSAQAEVKDVQ